ncbi:MAG: bifunctional methylenetetrahydrofolate dehydrogenase/methenyltetrahydrofolate cyclohydrolase FolD [Chloroherpetonaceae bacterium]|nr:bifunctional methylenetetrahydrofolate dehydrogenase/methenyltetrahydrofolate cyclohydrolase FolD [Chloroherpetonaceae bacterium]MCS7211406.1 bifunctional methylenetetrahydrofolate dehydrogenase/methenyltetrahydrofolate cyclohydrolase FolD [Chloroherpetonaceae bacterium]MDW8020993.1 bifunctional methylenetetrahydrofolate dehydrogenase/methenyltetrahydrofolate cyclohydrolase FolD [Chloroherpetonaceae bacterium]MDW8465677.1 bifunctional methylenetetrahydrofolate dehydrogenase/methenyltetrahydro
MILLDGKKISDEIKSELAQQIAALRAQTGEVPGLAVILVGENPASQIYVRNKAKACAEVGIRSTVIELPEHISQAELLEKIAALNADASVHGILVQQPLPKQIDDFAVTLAIAPHKDVDGFHPENVGRLVIGRLEDCFVSCTPFGVLELLRRYRIETAGKHCVVLGRSNIVGKPMANLMLQKLEGMNATVTVCHSASHDIPSLTKQADILIAAIGKAHFVKAEMVKAGAVVIDVGINRIADSTTKSGTRIVGDVDFDAVSKVASAITPVPGGVGPMTIAMLLQNTVKSFLRMMQKS